MSHETNIFLKTVYFIEGIIPPFNASFDAFFVQIDQLFEAQRVFEECLNIDKSLVLKENVVDFGTHCASNNRAR